MTEEHEERNLAPALARIGDHNLPIPLGDLKVLSDLGDEDLALFQAEWPTFELSHRRSLAQAMQELGEESLELDFREAFATMLDDIDPGVRVAAARGLSEDTRRSTLRRLLRLLNEDHDDLVRATAATTLGAWTLRIAEGDLDDRTGREVEEALLATFNDPAAPAVVRQRLLETLGYFGEHDEIIAAIERAAESAEESWQQSAICAMGHSGMKRWLKPIKAALAYQDPILRFEAARAAGELGDVARALVADVARLSADRDVEVATSAILALGQIGGDAAKRFLEQLVRQSEGARLEAANEALHELQFFDDPMGTLDIGDDDDDEE